MSQVPSLPFLSDVPERYEQIIGNILKDGNNSSNEISLKQISKVLADSKLHQKDKLTILRLIYPNSRPSRLTISEFKVLLAIIALAQANEEITISHVLRRRLDLPIPDLPTAPRPSTVQSCIDDTIDNIVLSDDGSDLSKSPNLNNSFDFPEADPWASSTVKRNYRPKSEPNGAAQEGTFSETRKPLKLSNNTTSDHSEKTTMSYAQLKKKRSHKKNPSPKNLGTSNNNITKLATSSDINGMNNIYDDPPQYTPTKSDHTSAAGRCIAENNVKITLLPEKEGLFLFQHHCYLVENVSEGHKVVRRFSDFVWLLDYLQKRFPFRQLPLLPPKRLGLNGTHLAADSMFIEKRRRGLVRFTNALLIHPILEKEQAVKEFLRSPTEFSVLRKQSSFPTQDEFSGVPLPPDLEDSLPQNLTEIFDKSRIGIIRSSDIYMTLCVLMDRLAKRNKGFSADQLRISRSLLALSEVSADTYYSDSRDVQLLNDTLKTSSKRLGNSQALAADETTNAWDLGIVEELKKQRDCFVSMRDMFERRDIYDKDNIPFLERRIKKNQNKLAEMRSKPELSKPGEEEKLSEAIHKDSESIVSQRAKRVFVKKCILDELKYFQQTKQQLCKWSRDWAKERMDYSELQADNWKKLNDELEEISLRT